MDWIVHLDEALVVVNKPAGLLSVPGRGPDKQDCAWSRVLQRCPDALVVHRLDMATSGLLLFARGPVMQRALSSAFERRAVHKQYLAWVRGGPPAEAGEIALPLSADWPRRPLQKVDLAQGKPALTRWRVLAREAGRTRLLLEPVTGRSHQLRVHAAAQGWPIEGDTLYGAPQDPALPPVARLMLHAQRLQLQHPLATASTLCFESPAPF